MINFSLPKFRVKSKCPKHPGYNPGKSGATFRAGCRHCESIWTLYLYLSKYRGIGVMLKEMAEEISAGKD
jgi:hypothetical protein